MAQVRRQAIQMQDCAIAGGQGDLGFLHLHGQPRAGAVVDQLEQAAHGFGRLGVQIQLLQIGPGAASRPKNSYLKQ